MRVRNFVQLFEYLQIQYGMAANNGSCATYSDVSEPELTQVVHGFNIDYLDSGEFSCVRIKKWL